MHSDYIAHALIFKLWYYFKNTKQNKIADLFGNNIWCNQMRSDKAFKNMLSNIILQLVTAAVGIILPRLFIGVYGSEVNGLISSISQFITYMGLVEAGIGSAAIVSLYKPLADKNTQKINGVLSGAKLFYIKSGLFFVGLVLALVIFYPLLTTTTLPHSMVRLMIIILAGSGMVDYFLLGKYRVLLMADQHNYIITSVQTFGTILNAIVSVILIQMHASALLVKLVATTVYALRFLILFFYCRKHYDYLNFKAEPDRKAFAQRWSVLIHQITGLIVNNTHIIIMTLCLGASALKEVSVYGVYNMIAYTLFSLMNSFSTGLTSGFGEIISKKEHSALYKSFSNYEYMYFIIQSICYCCMAVLLLPFISVYSKEFADAADYYRPTIAVLFTLLGYLQTIRVPAGTIIIAAGHYRETRGRAIIESALNLAVALALVYPLGMSGVLIGSVVSYAWRSADMIFYNSRHLVANSLKRSLSRILRNLIAAGLFIAVGLYLVPSVMDSFWTWVLYAAATGVSAVILFAGINLLFEKNEFIMLMTRLKNVLKRKFGR